MKTPDYGAVLFAILVVALPFFATRPSVGGFIARKPSRLPLLLTAVSFGLLGGYLAHAGIVTLRVGLSFFAPLWQIVLIQVAYAFWFRFHERPPVDVTYNWNEGLFWDRVLVMAIVLLGILVPASLIVNYVQ